MTPTPNEDRLQQVLDEASDIAARAGVPYCSGHLVMALLGLENRARPLLVDRGGLSASGVASELSQLEHDPEPGDMLTRIRDRSLRMAQSCGAKHVGALHLLMVLCTQEESTAHRVMIALGLNLASLRHVALTLAVGGRRDRRMTARPMRPVAEAEASVEDPEEAASAEPEPIPPPADAAMPDLASGSTRSPEEGDDADLSSTGQLLRTLPHSRVTRSRLVAQDPRVTRGNVPEAEEPEGEEVRFYLNEDEYPTLSALGRNLSRAAAMGQVEALVGRRGIIERILDILGKRRANNPCLVGEPGVGKTAIMEGLAWLQVHEPAAVPLLEGRVLVELNMGSMLSGTALRGSFSERMAALRQEVEAAEGKVVVFLDELHTLVGAGAVGDGALDAVGELSAAMARGAFPCVGATTTDNYKKHIEESPALSRRLEPVLVPEPSPEDALEILRGVMPAYAEHHQVTFLPEALDAAVRLSGRYIADRFLPDKAISLLDLAGSRSRRKAQGQVGRAEVARLVAEGTGIPADRLLMEDTERFLNMEDFIHERVVGHREMVHKVCQVVRRNYAGFASNRPIGSFLFLGPTGVGKTETVKVLADFLFQSRDALCRFDMSEFQEQHSVARLIGSPPGYVGHEQGGQLTESVRRKPYQIVLLDEVEKAHRDVLQVLLQLLDDGRLTDGRGRTVDFSNTVVVMTSNLGSHHYDRGKGPIGFGAAAVKDDGEDPDWPRIAGEVLGTARKAFPIELWNRIEERLVFRPLTRQDVLEVARLLVADSSERLRQEKQISFEATEAALGYLIEHGGYDPMLGARPMRTTIQRLIEAAVAEEILRRTVKEGDHLRVDVGQEDRLVVERAPRTAE